MRYVYLDARYEKMRENGSVRNLAVFTAIGVNEEGRRSLCSKSVRKKSSRFIDP